MATATSTATSTARVTEELSSATAQSQASDSRDETMSNRYAILDCDGGSDDAWALLLLLRAEQAGRVQLLAVTTTGCGNTSREQSARNMRRILSACGREDVPIYLGAVEPLIVASEGGECDEKTYFHGRDGFGDVLDCNKAPVEEIVEPLHAVTAIKDICASHPKQVTLCAVGPLTNLALGYAMYGSSFGEHFKELVIMGGNYQGVGNSSRAAEFNFHSDPEAAHAVLLKTRCPIIILPWEPCLEDRFALSLSWRLEDFGLRAAAANHEAISLLNRVERAQWGATDFTNWCPCDAMAVAAWLFEPQLVKKQSSWHATVDLSGFHTRGQMVLDHLREREKYPENVRILELLDVEFFKQIVEWIAGLRDEASLQQS